MVTGFQDKKDLKLHEDFQAWRQKHPKGFVLHIGNRVLVHRAQGCWHLGGEKWSGDRRGKRSKESLTAKRKVCSGSQAELLSWADKEAKTPAACSACIREPLTNRRTVRVRYVEYTPQPKVLIGARPAHVDATDVGRVLEGVAKETKITSRSRSGKLRREAVKRANGICEACTVDFSKLLDGDGRRVLQAHHRNQVALYDVPRLNGIEDLAVLCANCHVLVHLDVSNAMSVASLRCQLLRSSARK